MQGTNSKYWDINRTLSHNCLFNFIISLRGGGKTYGCLKYAVRHFLNAKRAGQVRQFVYLRRQENELKKLCISRGGRLFDAVKGEFEGHTLKAESNTLYCDGEVCGYAMQLSTAFTQKSDAFPNVDLIIFDEFIAVKRSSYLPDEVTKFLELYETIARPGTDHPTVRVFFLGNAVTQTNPYFEYFYLDRPYQGEFKKFGPTKDILVQDVDVPELQADKHKSRFGQLIAGSEYASYAIDNENIIDAGGASGKLYSIICVRFIPGEVTGLYSPQGFKNGAMLDIKPINNGSLYHDKDGVLVYGVRFKGYFGVQLANPKAVSAIVNVGSSNIPTADQLDDLLINARAKEGTTFMFMHPKTLSLLNKYKGELLRTANDDNGVNRSFDSWNKIKIITSYNFLDGAETKVTLD